MASRCSKQTSAESFSRNIRGHKFSVSPDSKLDESEFELSSSESDYNANSRPSCNGGGTDSENALHIASRIIILKYSIVFLVTRLLIFWSSST